MTSDNLISVSSNLIPTYLRTTLGFTEPTSSRQPHTVSATTAISAGASPRTPAPVPTEDQSGVVGLSDGQDEQSRIVQRQGSTPHSVCVCVFITAVPITKLFAWGDSAGLVLRETMSRGLSGLVCPSRPSEPSGEKKGSARGSVHWGHSH